MKRTLREKIVFSYRKFAQKHKLLKYPAIAIMTVALFFVGIFNYFAGNQKKYLSILMVLCCFMLSASFSFPVLWSDASFVSPDEGIMEVNAVLDDSVEFAKEEAITLSDISEAENTTLESEELKEYDQYSLDEILMEGNDISGSLDNIANEFAGTFHKDDWNLILINKQHPIPEDYSFKLGTIKGSMQCDERILPYLLEMLQEAKKDGVDLVICSPYRSPERQEMLFQKKVTNYMNRGISYIDAYKLSSQAVTIPGSSEHEIGLSLDIICSTYSSLDEGFGSTKAGMWLEEHCKEYGFIVRYPKDKEYITSIEYEPWHFRYVGVEAATIIMDEKLTLEEFLDYYV